MDLTLPVICDALQTYNPVVTMRQGKPKDLSIRSSKDFSIVTADQLMPDSPAYQEKIIFVIGNRDFPADSVPSKAVIYVDGPGLTERQLRGELFRVKTKFDRWSQRLLSAIVDEIPLSEFLTMAAEVFPCPIFIENLYGQIIAEVGIGAVRPEHFSAKTGVTTFQIHYKFKRFAKFNLVADAQNITEGCIYIARYFVSVLEYYFSILQAKGMESDDSTSLLSKLIKGVEVDRSIVEFQLNKQGWRINDSYFVMTADFSNGEQMSVRYLNALSFELKNNLPNLMFYQNVGQIFIIANQKNVPLNRALLLVLQDFSKQHDLHMGISSVFQDFLQLGKYCKEATYALNRAIQSAAGPVLRYEEVRGQFLKEYLLSADHEYGDIVHPKVELLDRLDDNSEQQYVRTLYFYLLSGSNISAAARKLFVDRNTLLYRLGKIGDILGFDITKEAPDDIVRLHYLISCYITMYRSNEPVNQ